MYALSSFFLQALRAMIFPLSTAFIVSPKFGYVVPSFLLNSKKYFLSFFLSSLTNLSLNRVLFSFYMYVGFVVIEDQPYSVVIGRMHGIILVFLYILISVLLPVT